MSFAFNLQNGDNRHIYLRDFQNAFPHFDIKAFEPINKGLSEDKKFCIETVCGKRMFLRVSDIGEYERKKAEYNMMERAYAHGVFTSQPLGFGFFGDKRSVYALSGWICGDDVETALVDMSFDERYHTGIKAGAVLRKIHSVPHFAISQNEESWRERFFKKVQGRIDFYNSNNTIKSENGDIIIGYLKEKRYLLTGRPQTFCHGDYNISNLMLTPDGNIGVIDYNSYNLGYGDPWWEFAALNWGSEPDTHYFTGLIDGYFAISPPPEFFCMLRYYFAYDALASLCDTSVGNQGEPEEGRRHLDNIIRWFGGMKKCVPTWYNGLEFTESRP